MLLHNDLRHTACRLPDKIAVVDSQASLTYQSLYSQAHDLANYLVSHGLERGDRVIIFAGSRVESAVAIYGTLVAGGCFCPINPSVKAPRLRYLLANSGARFVIGSSSMLPVISEAAMGSWSAPHVLTFESGSGMTSLDEITKTARRASWDSPIDLDLAAIIYTSGSTGDPKGVTLTHRNMMSAVNSISAYLGYTESDIILNALPLSFDYGLYQLLMSVRAGSTLMLRPGLGYPYETVEIIRKMNVTVLPFVPTMMAIILQLENLGSHGLASVGMITNTAAAMPPSYIPRLKRAFPNARIFSMYGLTECKRVSYVPPAMLDFKSDSVGIPMPGIEVWIEDERRKRLGPGQIGELVVRGPNVMQGYWNDPAETAKRLRPGKYPWEKVLLTGDLFRMDEDGYLYFVARKDSLIKSRGERIAPREIENVLYALPEVLVARVTGEPHEILGQAIKAEIVLRNGARITANQVKAYCQQQLEDFKIPQIVEFVDSLPVSDSGKVTMRSRVSE